MGCWSWTIRRFVQDSTRPQSDPGALPYRIGRRVSSTGIAPANGKFLDWPETSAEVILSGSQQARYYDLQLSPLRDWRGNQSGRLLVMRDVTQRKAAEEALSQERDLVQKYLDIVEVMLVALNEEGEITLINRKGCHILGYQEEELIGQNWFDVCLPPAVRPQIW